MRIRKNSVRVTSNSETHFCQLNQSPWDVPTNLSSSAPFFQVREDESCLENKPLESVASVLKISLGGGEKIGCVNYEEQEKEPVAISYCSKTDENGNLICGLEAKQGETLCEFHLQSYAAAVGKKSTNRAKKSKSESNLYKDLYYYDEFEPTWGKRKIARELSKRGENVAMQLPPYLKDSEDAKEEAEVENGRKRAGRRRKARPIKSLL